jgi:hypothetical protein
MLDGFVAVLWLKVNSFSVTCVSRKSEFFLARGLFAAAAVLVHQLQPTHVIAHWTNTFAGDTCANTRH